MLDFAHRLLRVQTSHMALVRERRKKQALRLTVPSPPKPSPWQRFQSPSPLSSSSSNSNSNMNSPTITSLAGFERLAVLGHGNGGTVYKVCHKPANEIYALKVLRPVEHTERVQKRAMNEAEILRRVDSRFVVVCHGVFEDGFSGTCGGGGGAGDVCFLMEYMEGGSLHDLLQKHPKLSENAISCIARSVLEGLRYLHSMQIVHGDIKPSNLLINSEGRVKIADFGVSRIIAKDDEQKHQCSMGTCAYMSPERIDPERWDGVHSNGYAGDVWSLGVVVMECFTGHFPLIGAGEKPDWITLVSVICSEEEENKRKMLEMASAEIQSFVRRCLQKDWRIRGTVEELLGHPFVTRLEDGATHLLNYTSVALAE